MFLRICASQIDQDRSLETKAPQQDPGEINIVKLNRDKEQGIEKAIKSVEGTVAPALGPIANE